MTYGLLGKQCFAAALYASALPATGVLICGAVVLALSFGRRK